jgi:hypothetical protein
VTGTKHDAGKLRHDLIPFGGIDEVAQVATDGAARHGEGNWRLVADGERRYWAALCRHLFAMLKGEDVAAEHGTSHLAHVVWNGLALLELRAKSKETP